MLTQKILPTDSASLAKLGSHAPFLSATTYVSVVLKIVTVCAASYSLTSLISKPLNLQEFSFGYWITAGMAAALMLFLSNFYTANIRMATHQLYDKIDDRLQSPWLYAFLGFLPLVIITGLDFVASNNIYSKHLDNRFEVVKDSSHAITQSIILKELSVKETIVRDVMERKRNAKNEILNRNGTESYKALLARKAEKKFDNKLGQTQIVSNKTILALSEAQRLRDSTVNANNAKTELARKSSERSGTAYLFILNLILNVILGFIVWNTVRIETLCGVVYSTKHNNDMNVFKQSAYVLNAIFVKNVNNAMSWLYNVLTPNNVIELKDMPMVKAKTELLPEVKENIVEDAIDNETETNIAETKEAETETETNNAMRFYVPSVNYTPTNNKERRTIGYNVPPQNATQTQIAHQVPDVKKVIEMETITHIPPKEVMYRHSDVRIIKVEDTTFCDYCNKEFKALTKRAKFCSSTCRVKNHKEKNK